MGLALPPERERLTRLEEIRAELDCVDLTQLDAWLADPKVSHARIATALTNAGYPISAGSVRNGR